MRSAKNKKETRGLVGDRRGAALAEFAIAILPLVSLFFVIVEVGIMFSAHLVLHHAAIAAARCGIVTKGGYSPGDFIGNQDGKKGTDNGKAETVCQQAAIDATGEGFWHKTLWDIKVSYDLKQNAAGKHDEGYGDLVTTVDANYRCAGPVLSQIAICGSNGGTKPLEIKITLPHEGAQYTIDSNKNGG